MRSDRIQGSWMMGSVGVLCVILTACGSVTAQPLADKPTEIASPDNEASRCNTQYSSTLPGVRIEFPAPRCSWSLAEARAGLHISYELHIDQDIEGVIPRSRNCALPGPSGLILFEDLRGNGQSYCLCDQGLCAEPSDDPSTARKGVYARTFKWEGRNWDGPSDMLNPKGKFFPTGTYTLTISVQGYWQGPSGRDVFKVVGTIDINLHE